MILAALTVLAALLTVRLVADGLTRALVGGPWRRELQVEPG